MSENPREEMEAQLTALLLGELGPEEAAAIRAAVAQDPALAELQRRLERTIELVREVAATREPEALVARTPLQLAADRRERLKAAFKVATAPVRPRDLGWVVPMSIAAMFVALIGSVVLLPLFSSKSRRTLAMAERPVATLDLAKAERSAATRDLNQIHTSPGITTVSGSASLSGGGGGGIGGGGGGGFNTPAVTTVNGPASLSGAGIGGGAGGAYGGFGRTDAEKSQRSAGKPVNLSQPGALPQSPGSREAGAVAISGPGPVAPGALPAQTFGDYDNDSVLAVAGLAITKPQVPQIVPSSGRSAGGADLADAAVKVAPEPPIVRFEMTGPVDSFRLADTMAETNRGTTALVTATPSSALGVDKDRLPVLGDTPGLGKFFFENKVVGVQGGTAPTYAPAAVSQAGSTAGTPLAVAYSPDGAAVGQGLPGTPPVASLSPQMEPQLLQRDALLPEQQSKRGAVAESESLSTASNLRAGRSAQPAPTLKAGVNPLYHNNGNGDFTKITTPAEQDSRRRLAEVAESAAQLTEDRSLSRVQLKEVVEGKDDMKSSVPARPAPVPQPEVESTSNPFSTFSLNVSDVSFKLAAASLEQGRLPEASTIRNEEFINAFDYRDPEPPHPSPVGFAWERARYPFAHDRDLLRFSVKTAAAGRQPGAGLNIVLLLDRSGSMERADRVQIVREALRVLASQLQPQDKLSVITFARTPRLWADGISGNNATPVLEQISNSTPEGGTNLEEALNLAYQTALKHLRERGGNRVVLMTDGAANLGNVDPDALKVKVENYRREGIALDCFGIGWEGFDDQVLETLSRNGDGRYRFLNTPEEAASGFAAQLTGAFHVAASDVKVQVEFNPQRVSVYRQIGYAKHQLTKEQFRDNSVDAAEIGAAESGNALYVVQVNPAGDGPLAVVRARYKLPETGEYHEQEWSVPYTGQVPSLEQASASLRLAGTASAFSEWLAGSPFAAEVTPDRLISCLNGVAESYGSDPRPRTLETMIRQAKSLGRP